MDASTWIERVRDLGRRMEKASGPPPSLTFTLGGGPAANFGDAVSDEWTDEDQRRLQDPAVYTAFDRPERLLTEIVRLEAENAALRQHVKRRDDEAAILTDTIERQRRHR